MTAADLLGIFKALDKQRAHAAIVIVDDPEALRVAAAWTSYPISWQPDKHMPDVSVSSDTRSLAKAWHALWAACKYDETELAAMAGVPEETTESILYVLGSNRMIFPDGSISEWAQARLRNEVAARLGVRKKAGE